MKKMICLLLAIVFQIATVAQAMNLGYDKGDVNRERLLYDMGTGKLNALPWEYRLAFLIGGYDFPNIPDMIFSLKEGEWVQLEKGKQVEIIKFNKEKKLVVEEASLKEGDWVLKNGSNILLTKEGNVIKQQTWEWWRTETFRQIVALVGFAALAAILGAIIANNVGGDTTIISGGSTGGVSPLPAKPGGPAPLPFN